MAAAPELASPRPAALGRLMGKDGSCILLSVTPFSVGRVSSLATHVIPNNLVSKVHFVISLEGNDVWLEDKSSNGTWVFGKRVSEEPGKRVRLSDNDIILIARNNKDKSIPEYTYHAPSDEDSLYVDYVVGVVLGSGSFGEVRRVVDRITGFEYAVKAIHKTMFLKRPEKVKVEMEIMSKLDHPNIVRLHRALETKKKIFLILELLKGGDMQQLLNEDECYTETRVRSWMKQLVGAIAYLHENKVAHRDLKPANILFADEARSIPKITDFGISRQFNRQDSVAGTFCGTPHYIAPEIVRSAKKGYAHQVDMWSLGVIMYRLLSGKLLFEGDNQAAIFNLVRSASEHVTFDDPCWANVSTNAKDLVARLLRSDPTMRITAVDAMQHPWLLEGSPVPTQASLPALTQETQDLTWGKNDSEDEDLQVKGKSNSPQSKKGASGKTDGAETTSLDMGPGKRDPVALVRAPVSAAVTQNRPAAPATAAKKAPVVAAAGSVPLSPASAAAKERAERAPTPMEIVDRAPTPMEIVAQPPAVPTTAGAQPSPITPDAALASADDSITSNSNGPFPTAMDTSLPGAAAPPTLAQAPTSPQQTGKGPQPRIQMGFLAKKKAQAAPTGATSSAAAAATNGAGASAGAGWISVASSGKAAASAAAASYPSTMKATMVSQKSTDSLLPKKGGAVVDCFIAKLPDELLGLILSFLPYTDLGRASRVCKRWQDASLLAWPVVRDTTWRVDVRGPIGTVAAGDRRFVWWPRDFPSRGHESPKEQCKLIVSFRDEIRRTVALCESINSPAPGSPFALARAGSGSSVKIAKETISRLVVPAIGLMPLEGVSVVGAVGDSKWGGVPDLPPKTQWPFVQQIPLPFLCQIRCSDLVNKDLCGHLPADEDAMLYFFGGEGSGRGHASVLYISDLSNKHLAATNPPNVKPLCTYDGKCFRKNPDHYTEFAHPKELKKSRCAVAGCSDQSTKHVEERTHMPMYVTINAPIPLPNGFTAANIESGLWVQRALGPAVPASIAPTKGASTPLYLCEGVCLPEELPQSELQNVAFQKKAKDDLVNTYQCVQQHVTLTRPFLRHRLLGPNTLPRDLPGLTAAPAGQHWLSLLRVENSERHAAFNILILSGDLASRRFERCQAFIQELALP